jgi:hypothetical protein
MRVESELIELNKVRKARVSGFELVLKIRV